MRLEAFRVQNYKKIRDTEWISCLDLTAFVGKNESGKSAIFRGLSKLNPSDGEKYDGLKEFPRRRYTDEFHTQDWPGASGRFVLNEEERKILADLCPVLKGVKRVEVTRYYSWKLTATFDPSPRTVAITCSDLQDAIDKAIQQAQQLTAPEGKGEVLGSVKQSIINALQQAKANVSSSGVASKSQVDQALNAVVTHTNEDWQKKLLDPIMRPFQQYVEECVMQEKLAAARKWVGERLPQFIYFDKYDVIDSAIHIPTFVQQLANNSSVPHVRTSHCLFKHVGLDVQRLASLGRHRPEQGQDAVIQRQIDERAILASSASNAMTQKFEDWWEQRKHKFRYQLDGDYFRIWVSDDLDPSEIELDQRSAGMQYFFSFFIVFLVEAEGAHSNSILLLDEPGLHLHGTAQAKIVKFLEKLSKENQTFYSTHSPFMVDMDHLERARAVYEHEDGTTKVSEDVWPRDRDSLFPLQAALGYQLAQGLFVGKRQLLVEGLTDYWLVKAVDQALGLKGRTRLRPDLVVIPSAGLSKLLPLASMLIGHQVEVSALLDGDEPARKEGKKLAEKLLANEDRKCLFIGDFVDNQSAEIEDLFPEEEYLSAVREAYRGVALTFTAAEKDILGITNRISALFERKELGRFEKWKPAAVLRDRILSFTEEQSEAVLGVFERIFQAVNALFGGEPAPAIQEKEPATKRTPPARQKR